MHREEDGNRVQCQQYVLSISNFTAESPRLFACAAASALPCAKIVLRLMINSSCSKPGSSERIDIEHTSSELSRPISSTRKNTNRGYSKPSSEYGAADSITLRSSVSNCRHANVF